MQCKQCGYRLWNIQSRNCPECGQGFTPSEFDYVPGSVAFCCPHCDQSYYGTDEHGQLVPREFECIGCGNHIHMDQMILRPADGYEEQQTRQNVNPWESKEKGKSTIMMWLRTCKLAMLQPTALVSERDASQGMGAPIGFLFFHTAMVMLCGAGVLLLFAMASEIMGGDGTANVIFMVGGLALGIIVAMLAALLFIAIWSGITHGILCVLSKPAGRYADTFECMCYSHGATILTAIPICGIYVLGWLGVIWWPISAAIMLGRKHHVTVFKALIAVWVLPVMFFAGIIGVVGYTAYSIGSNIAASGGYNFNISTLTLGQDILNQINDDQTIGPKHVAEFYFDNKHNGWQWQIMDMNPNNYTGGVQEGFGELDQVFQDETPDIKQAHRNQLIAAINQLSPYDHAGYRFGSLLFLHNKVTTDKLDPELWLIVQWPRHMKTGVHKVFKANGTEAIYTTAQLQSALDQQNALRRKLELPVIETLDAIRILPIPTHYSYAYHDESLEKYKLSEQITAMTRDDGQIGPDHVLRFLMQDKLTTALFADMDGSDIQSAWQAGQATNPGMNNWHGKWVQHATSEQTSTLISRLDELPARTGPGYRFGQMVMLYDGITKDKLDDRLWLAVRWPKNYAPEQTKIYLADGRMIHVLTDDMPKLLAEQDNLRETLGLPVIGNLSDIREVPVQIDPVN